MSKVVVKVSRLAGYLKHIMENDIHLQNIIVQGEISNFTSHKSGHWYFSLKDESALIRCVMFHTYSSNVKFKPKDGDLVLVRARVTMFEPSGQLQLNVNAMKMDGVGDLYLQFEALKKKLASQGLFDAEHKKVLPKYPMNIAIVTGDKTAALRDCLTTIARRWPIANVKLHSCLVQGDSASKQIIDTLKNIDSDNYDVILLVRGGGSIEDLWAFNSEELAHTIYNLKTPIITGVGHETDTTIVDYVSDFRAPTPTGAAMVATPDINDVLMHIRQYQVRIESNMQKMIETTSMRLDHLNIKMENIVNDRLNDYRKKLTKNQNDLQLIIKNNVHKQRNELIDYRYKMNDVLLKNIKQNEYRIHFLKQSLINKVVHKKELTINKFNHQIKLLDAYSPLKVMQRGYSVAYCNDTVINSVKNISADDELRLRVSDGEIYTKVRMVKEDEGR